MTAPENPPLTGDTVPLIHGLWMTPRSWQPWVERLEAMGHRAIARSWPGVEGEVEAVRSDPSRLRNPFAVNGLVAV